MNRMRVLLAVSLLTVSVPLAAAERATEGFRHEHAKIQEHLGHLSAMNGSLQSSSTAEQKKTAASIVKFLKEHILEHAKWEEQHLYPAVDRRTGGDEHRFTTSMRYEHTIIGRSISELNALASRGDLPATEFARKSDRLLGVISAHFEKEEEVFLPILDRTTTREQLERELGE